MQFYNLKLIWDVRANKPWQTVIYRYARTFRLFSPPVPGVHFDLAFTKPGRQGPQARVQIKVDAYDLDSNMWLASANTFEATSAALFLWEIDWMAAYGFSLEQIQGSGQEIKIFKEVLEQEKLKDAERKRKRETTAGYPDGCKASL